MFNSRGGSCEGVKTNVASRRLQELKLELCMSERAGYFFSVQNPAILTHNEEEGAAALLFRDFYLFPSGPCHSECGVFATVVNAERSKSVYSTLPPHRNKQLGLKLWVRHHFVPLTKNKQRNNPVGQFHHSGLNLVPSHTSRSEDLK